MSKDSAETQQRLLDAVGRVLARDGFEHIGVNVVAREAGVDKVLIYRYFGGLKGLVTAFCRQDGFWPTPVELMGGDKESFARKPYAEQLADSAIAYLRALRKRPLMREILAWRFLVHNELTLALDDVRAANWAAVFPLLNAPPPSAAHDYQAFQAVVGAAVNHLGTRAGALPEFAGLDLRDEAGWARIEAMMRKMIGLVLSAGETHSA